MHHTGGHHGGHHHGGHRGGGRGFGPGWGWGPGYVEYPAFDFAAPCMPGSTAPGGFICTPDGTWGLIEGSPAVMVSGMTAADQTSVQAATAALPSLSEEGATALFKMYADKIGTVGAMKASPATFLVVAGVGAALGFGLAHLLQK